MEYRCGNRERRQAVADATTINGIDYLEVAANQLALHVYFIHNVPGGGGVNPIPAAPALTMENFVLEGGVRIQDVRIVPVTTPNIEGRRVIVAVDKPGDFSPYRLRLVKPGGTGGPPPGFDPELADIEFSFKVDCPSDFDCVSAATCPAPADVRPPIDYLAKDYSSFRRLMLDRLSLITPEWRDRSAADIQMMIVEWLAYVGDHLSYFQDAVATEAYLGTARKRASVRRHARALDYRIHEGANARCFVIFAVAPTGPDTVALPAATPLVTKTSHPTAVLDTRAFQAVVDAGSGLVFETLHPATLHRAHNRISFYTWSDGNCCLPRGATRATLLNDPTLALQPGDVLILEEIRGADSGLAADADPAHRHPVRLSAVASEVDPLTNTPVLRVQWSDDDALPFPLRVSALISEAGLTPAQREIAVARGNVVLADHGTWVVGTAQAPGLVPPSVADAPRYRPRLSFGPLTFRAPVDLDGSARAALHSDPRRALPVITLQGKDATWSPLYDLLNADEFTPAFVVETEDDGSAALRFGDGDHGRRPIARDAFTAQYRVGNGRSGNIGADGLAHVVGTGLNIDTVRNPLPAVGGEDPEMLDHVREFAPQAFRKQERAVTERDYAEIAERDVADVQHAQATFRWTGSWHTAFVTIDRLGGLPVDAAFREQLRIQLEPFRMAGYDVEINAPRFVPLDIKIRVCVAPGYFRVNVKQSLLRELSTGVLPDGRLGVFHPDNLSLGQPLYLSRIYDAAMRVDGVASIDVLKFQRWGHPAGQELANGVIRTARLEILRLDNDPNFPENGRLEFEMLGGL